MDEWDWGGYDDLGGVSGGMPTDFDWGSVDFGNFDLGSLDLSGLENYGFDLSNLDLSGLDLSGVNLGDLSGWGADAGLGNAGTAGFGTSADEVGGAGAVDLGNLGTTVLAPEAEGTDIGELDLSELDLNRPYQDLEDTGTLLNDEISGIEGFGAAADEVGQGTAGITGIEGVADAADEVGGAGAGATTSTAVDPYEVDGAQGSRTEGTALVGTETDPYGIDGAQTSRDEADVLTGARDTGGITTGATRTITDLIRNILTDGNRAGQVAGLLGLLSSLFNKPKVPGYVGGIPKYMATRGPRGQGTRFVRQAAGGGLMDLAAGGRPARYLRGGTDGMADKIKTHIDGKQPARLSHGEFVIPADVVSHLGNGNSDAGADVLYDMMAKVRKARTGTAKQGKQINPRKYTPA